MKKYITIIHYVVLGLIMVTGVWLFISLSGNRGWQLITGIMTSLAYISWGMIHHSLQGDLHKKIVVEYVLIGAIAIILLFIVLMA